MPETKTIGDFGESRAALFLQEQGLQVLARNYRTRRGELDIVARDGQTLCFVEVRLREDARYGSPLETVRRQKQRRIYFAAMEYLVRNKYRISNCACRFDVIAIERVHQRITWIRSAFSGFGEAAVI